LADSLYWPVEEEFQPLGNERCSKQVIPDDAGGDRRRLKQSRSAGAGFAALKPFRLSLNNIKQGYDPLAANCLSRQFVTVM
jgi:hypothetical protein